VANFDAAPNRDPVRAAELLVRQVDGPVRWEESIRRMAAEGVTHALEIGPGKVLAGLVKRIAKDIKVLSVGDAAAVREAATFVRSAVS
jgi:[acyl-carrier-protein] S-malonyltransferase